MRSGARSLGAGGGVLALVTLLAGQGLADVEQVAIGARAIGMGGAYSSLADDATALFWNPAGLAWIGHQEFSATRADLFGSGIVDNQLALVLPLSARQVVGIDWYHSGFDDGVLGFGENRVSAAWSRRFAPWASAAITGKFLTRSTELDGATLRRGSGVGMDLGAIVAPGEGLRLGLVGQDLLGTRLHYDDGQGDATVYPRTVRVAGSYAWRQRATLGFDLDDRWHLGLEVVPLPELALRVGGQDDLHGDDGATWSYGAGLKVGALHVDYAYEQHPMLRGSHHVGLAVDFNLNPARIRIEKVEAHDVYASLYRAYAGQPIGTAQIRNLDDKPIETQVSVFVPDLMDAPVRQSVILRPKAVQEVQLRAAISPRVLRQTDDQSAQVQVGASYPSRRLVRTEKASARFIAYAPGAIDWSQGVAQAAAFVTPRDPMVEAVAREAVRVVAADGATRFGTRNLAYACALFDALGSLEIAYVPDPNNPFTAISETAHAVDTIQYPSQTLTRRTGDCDDTTVLMAALLGSVGVNTQLVDAPGHVFLMLDTGLHERNRTALQVDDRLLVVRGDGVWIPLETTAIPKGFAEAWRVAADSYQSWAERGQIELVDVAQAQGRYEPSNPVNESAAPALDAGRLAGQVGRDGDAIASWTREWLEQQEASAPSERQVSVEALDELAHTFFLAGRAEEARGRLEQALKSAPESPKLKNNMGLVLACLGDLKGGVDRVVSARQTSPDDPCIWINEGLIRLASADSVEGWRALAEGVGRAGSEAEAVKRMGLEVAADGDRLFALLGEATRRKQRASGGMRSGEGSRGVVRADELKRFLFWKE